jgi:uncharacterized integral membrane protein
MRTPLSFLIGLLTVATAVALGILVMQNGQDAAFSFLGNTLQAPQGWAVAGAAVLGFVLAYLLLIPGRLASSWRTWWLGRQTHTLETKLLALQEEHTRLQGSHQRLLEEHRHVVDQVLAPVPSAPAPTPEAVLAEASARPAWDAPWDAPGLPPAHLLRIEQERASQRPNTVLERMRGRYQSLRASIQEKVRRLRERTAGRADG